jgi:hypothetical protein
MASEAFVDLSYRGLVLGKRVRLLQVGPRSAYVAHDAPMPVGTELVLTVDESLAIRAQVARVREGDSKDGPAGMWLWAGAAEQRARAWWDEHVSADDPRIPEPGGGRIRVEAPVATAPTPESPAASRDLEVAEQAGHAVDTAAAMPSDPQPDRGPHEAASGAGDVDDQGAGRSDEHPGDRPDEQLDARAGDARDEHTGEHDGDPLDEPAGEDDDDYAIEIARATTNAEREYDRAETGDLDEEPLELPRSNTPGRPVRGTEIMTAVEIADVLGQPAVLDGEAQLDAAELPGRQRDNRTTHVMSAVEVADVLASGGDGEPGPTDDASAKGKARKRRGRKRR